MQILLNLVIMFYLYFILNFVMSKRRSISYFLTARGIYHHSFSLKDYNVDEVIDSLKREFKVLYEMKGTLLLKKSEFIYSFIYKIEVNENKNEFRITTYKLALGGNIVREHIKIVERIEKMSGSGR